MHLLKSNGYGNGHGYGGTEPLDERHLLLMLAVRRGQCMA